MIKQLNLDTLENIRVAFLNEEFEVSSRTFRLMKAALELLPLLINEVKELRKMKTVYENSNRKKYIEFIVTEFYD